METAQSSSAVTPVMRQPSTSLHPLLSDSSPAYPSSLSSMCTPPGHRDGPESDDTMSLASSSSSITRKEFTIPDLWRPTIMSCIKAPTVDEQKKMLTTTVRNEISRDLVTQMYSQKQRPDRAFCTLVAKSLVKKYPFMIDTGKNVSGYVSYI